MKLRTKSARFDSSTNCAALQRRQRVVCWNKTADRCLREGKLIFIKMFKKLFNQNEQI